MSSHGLVMAAMTAAPRSAMPCSSAFPVDRPDLYILTSKEKGGGCIYRGEKPRGVGVFAVPAREKWPVVFLWPLVCTGMAAGKQAEKRYYRGGDHTCSRSAVRPCGTAAPLQGLSRGYAVAWVTFPARETGGADRDDR